MDKRQFEKLMTANALRQYEIIDDSALSDVELNKIILSEEFDGKMQTLLSKGERRWKTKKHLLRLAASFVLVLTITFSTLMSADATRASVVRFFERYFTTSNSANKDWDTEFNAQVLSNVVDAYLPSWIPDGYVAVNSEKVSKGLYIITYQYKNDKKQFIRFSQSETDVKSLNDTELKGLSKIESNGQIFYYGEKKQSQVTNTRLIWSTDNRSFSLTATIDKTTLLKVAKSLVLKNE